MLPALSLIPSEAEECVRVEYAGILAQLAATAHRFLMRLQGPVAQQQVCCILLKPRSCCAASGEKSFWK